MGSAAGLRRAVAIWFLISSGIDQQLCCPEAIVFTQLVLATSKGPACSLGEGTDLPRSCPDRLGNGLGFVDEDQRAPSSALPHCATKLRYQASMCLRSGHASMIELRFEAV